MYGNSNPKMSPDVCRRDLQGEAKEAKKRMEANNKFIIALETLVDCGAIHQIDHSEDRKTIFAIYGDFKIKQPTIVEEYNQLLKLIEKEG